MRAEKGLPLSSPACPHCSRDLQLFATPITAPAPIVHLHPQPHLHRNRHPAGGALPSPFRVRPALSGSTCLGFNTFYDMRLRTMGCSEALLGPSYLTTFKADPVEGTWWGGRGHKHGVVA